MIAENSITSKAIAAYEENRKLREEAERVQEASAKLASLARLKARVGDFFGLPEYSLPEPEIVPDPGRWPDWTVEITLDGMRLRFRPGEYWLTLGVTCEDCQENTLWPQFNDMVQLGELLKDGRNERRFPDGFICQSCAIKREDAAMEAYRLEHPDIVPNPQPVGGVDYHLANYLRELHSMLHDSEV
jgi:hypothetical protein